jgi:signal transduction histidine kinase
MTRRATTRRFAREHADVLIALLVLIEIELELALGHESGDVRRVATALAAVLYVAPLTLRRSRPALALLLAVGVAAAQGLLGGDVMDANGSLLVPVILCYALGSRLEPRAGLTGLAAGAALFGLASLVTPPRPDSVGTAFQSLTFVGILFASPWFVGRLAQERERRAEAFRELAIQAEAERAERERAAIAEERLRIGGELQDVLAHSVSAMVVQAAGARRMLHAHPAKARESILAVEEAGRETLGDMRRLLGMLRRDDDPRALAPQPGLDQLPDLVRELREGGLDCSMRIDGSPVNLTPGINLVGYRTVEAAARQAVAAGSHGMSIVVSYSPRELTLEVRGDGARPSAEDDLEAMSKRVALYDGQMQTNLEGGAFAVNTRLPLAEAVAA